MLPTTGNNDASNQDFEQYLRETVQNVIKETQQAQPGAQQTVQATPLELNIGGQTFNYKDKAELEAALNTFVQKTSQTVAELQQKASTVPQNVDPNAERFVTGDDEPQWDDSQFVKLMTDSPKSGFEYAFNQLFFGGASENPVEDIKRTFQDMEATKRTIAAYQFKENHPEFPGGADFANKIDTIRQEMGLPYDYNGLEAAYLVGMQRQQLPNFYTMQQQQLAQQQTQQQNQNQTGYGYTGYNPQQQQQWQGGFGQTNNPYLQAPPGLTRNSGTNQAPQTNFEDMSLEQLEQVIARINAGGSR